MKRHWLIIVLLLSLGLNLGLGLGLLRQHDAPPPPPMEPGPDRHERVQADGPVDREAARHFMGMRLERMSEELELGADQRSALETLYDRSSEAVMARRDAMIAARGDMHERLRAARSVEEFREVLLTHSRLQAELDSIVVDVMFQERTIMRDDQLEGYEEFMLPLGPRRGPGRGDRGGRHGQMKPRSGRGHSGP